LTGLAVLISEP